MFVRVLNTLLILICCFTVSCSNKAKYQFSRKYSPVYNPGGESFESNQEFSRAYSVYKERRDALVGDGNQQNVSKKKYGKLDNKHINRYDPIEDYGLSEGNDLQLMVDSNGINLADVAGARFVQSIDDDYEDDNVIKKHNDLQDKSGKLSKKNVKHVSSKSVSKKLDVKEKLLDDHVPVEEKYEIVEEDKAKVSIESKSSELDKNKVHVKEDKSKSLPEDKSKSDVNKLPAIKEDKAKVSIESKSSELDKSKVHVKEDKSKSLPEDKSELDTSKLPVVEAKDHSNTDESKLHLLLDFSKGNDKEKDLDNHHQPLKGGNSSKTIINDHKDSKQDTTHKVTHFLPELSEQNVTKDVEKNNSKGTGNNNLPLSDNVNKKYDNKNQQKSVKQHDKKDVKVKEEYDEDYSITYYYE
ncbi:TRP75-related protein [Ehrlichia ruminantium]|uniref:TRP75-related protein n=1 Tax=Ehrlichia ruminantium TaxID=779 RepID=UPI0015DD4A9D|nr:TRP75-related protein [Ehrlichia ruminantium]QLK57896.1 hypothetical protein FDZ59_02645 [Ehrlichia ruminantium]